MISSLITIVLVFAGVAIYFVSKAGGSVKVGFIVKVKWGGK